MPGGTSTLKSQQHLLKVHSSTYISVGLIFSLEVPSRSSLLTKLNKYLMSTSKRSIFFYVAFPLENFSYVHFISPRVVFFLKENVTAMATIG